MSGSPSSNRTVILGGPRGGGVGGEGRMGRGGSTHREKEIRA
jgi:hypothetical protein